MPVAPCAWVSSGNVGLQSESCGLYLSILLLYLPAGQQSPEASRGESETAVSSGSFNTRKDQFYLLKEIEALG